MFTHAYNESVDKLSEKLNRINDPFVWLYDKNTKLCLHFNEIDINANDKTLSVYVNFTGDENICAKYEKLFPDYENGGDDWYGYYTYRLIKCHYSFSWITDDEIIIRDIPLYCISAIDWSTKTIFID